MNFFTLESLELEGSEFAKVKEDYWAFFESIRSKVPTRLYLLHRSYSLHDSDVLSIVRMRNDKDIGMVIDGVANGHVADTDKCVIFLHFVNCGKVSGDELLGREIDIVEVGLGTSGCVLQLLHRNTDMEYGFSELEFEDFDFYLHIFAEPN